MNRSDEPLLRVEGLVKRYRNLVAVDGAAFDVAPGEFVGLIGPNGAGKSTTMGCIANVLAIDGGRVVVHGVDVSEDPVEARRQIGFVPQDLQLYEYLTGEEFLRFVASLRGLAAEAADARVEALLQLTELSGARDRVIKEYSGGMARKIAICAALLGPPPLLLLDESFVGLDPESTWRIRQELGRFCDQGGAIVLTSHILDMVERLCSRVLIMVDGRVARDLSREQMQAIFERGEYPDLSSIYLDTTGKRLELK